MVPLLSDTCHFHRDVLEGGAPYAHCVPQIALQCFLAAGKSVIGHDGERTEQLVVRPDGKQRAIFIVGARPGGHIAHDSRDGLAAVCAHVRRLDGTDGVAGDGLEIGQALLTRHLALLGLVSVAPVRSIMETVFEMPKSSSSS